MPRELLKASTIPPAKSETAFFAAFHAFLIPLTIPSIIFLPIPSIFFGNPFIPSINILAKSLAAFLAFSGNDLAKLTAFAITFARNDVTLLGKLFKKLITLLTNLLPASLPLLTIFEAHLTIVPKTVPMILPTLAGRFFINDTTLLGNCFTALIADLKPFGISSVKNLTNAFTTFPTKLFTAEKAVLTAFRNLSLVLYAVINAVTSTASNDAISMIGFAFITAFNAACAIDIPFVATDNAFIPFTTV